MQKNSLFSPFSLMATLRNWVNSDYFPEPMAATLARAKHVELDRLAPFILTHLGCLGILWVGASPFAVAFAIGFYFFRMFAITGFYHRYFAHRTFTTSRWMQCILAFWGMLAMQRGPLWWAAHHRHHHRSSDKVEDSHSPIQRGFWWSHMGWVAVTAHMPTQVDRVRDLAKFPELVWLNRYDWVPPLAMAIGLYLLGQWLGTAFPHEPLLRTSGLQLLVWGFFISTVLLFHGTFTINSLAHQWGSRRYETGDHSRNNFWLALITMGEGWHNNHHFYPGTARQGFYWWEIDISYYLLRLMASVGLIGNLKPVPTYVYEAKHQLQPTRSSIAPLPLNPISG